VEDKVIRHIRAKIAVENCWTIACLAPGCARWTAEGGCLHTRGTWTAA